MTNATHSANDEDDQADDQPPEVIEWGHGCVWMTDGPTGGLRYGSATDVQMARQAIDRATRGD